MRLVHGLAAILGGLCAFAAAEKAQASTVTLYYVGNPYTINNFQHPDDRRLMTTGSVVLDTARLPQGGLPGSRIVQERDYERMDGFGFPLQLATPGFVSIAMSSTWSFSSWNAGVDMTFDGDGRVARYRFWDDGYMPDCFAYCLSASGDIAAGTGGGGDFGFWKDEHYWFMVSPDSRHRFLSELGYTKDMPQYWKEFEREEQWAYMTYAEGPGMWFDNFTDAARQIEVNTQLALANPATSIYDIAPIPLPAPFALLLGGLGGLALLRRQAMRPQRS